MKPEIDIYADNPIVTLEYKIAVMQYVLSLTTADSRNLVQFRDRPAPGFSVFSPWKNVWAHNQTKNPVRDIEFDWVHSEYRIDPASKPKPPKSAQGHNPYNLTEDQVGVKDGWRLLTLEEIEHRKHSQAHAREDINMWVSFPVMSPYWAVRSYFANNKHNTYRTKQPPGFFLPKEKKRVPLTLEDFGAVTWIRQAGARQSFLVSGTQDYTGTSVGPWVCYNAYNGLSIPLKTLFDQGWEYSTDRVNWKPCYKEISE